MIGIVHALMGSYSTPKYTQAPAEELGRTEARSRASYSDMIRDERHTRIQEGPG